MTFNCVLKTKFAVININKCDSLKKKKSYYFMMLWYKIVFYDHLML